jgi:hypothetical protein
MNLIPETNLEKVQRMVFGCDTEAGYKLRYLITRAQADKQFADKIDFNIHFNAQESGTLDSLFVFVDTAEGRVYWYEMYHYITYGSRYCGGIHTDL